MKKISCFFLEKQCKGSTLTFQNKSFPVTCLFIFLAYILLYSPCGVTNVGISVLVVFVTFLKTFKRCARCESYALLISYSLLQYFISQIEIDLSERSISKSICVPCFKSSSASSFANTLVAGRYDHEQGVFMLPSIPRALTIS